jgi:hypothetical protein
MCRLAACVAIALPDGKRSLSSRLTGRLRAAGKRSCAD